MLSQAPTPAQPWAADLLRIVFEQPDGDAVQAHTQRVLDMLDAGFPKAPEYLDATQHDLLAFSAFPREIWPVRLVGAVLAE
ncbi:transposase [Streptomyces sp. NPDC051133]|uniref:transposase n=1 Tax=Streptomyces sp. NPDC051133 TaxID=3155521 RepID=UPI0034284DDD